MRTGLRSSSRAPTALDLDSRRGHLVRPGLGRVEVAIANLEVRVVAVRLEGHGVAVLVVVRTVTVLIDAVVPDLGRTRMSGRVGVVAIPARSASQRNDATRNRSSLQTQRKPMFSSRVFLGITKRARARL